MPDIILKANYMNKILGLFTLVILSTPSFVHAATTEPFASCTLDVDSVNRGSVILEGRKNDVVVRDNEWLHVSWHGDNALSAKDGLGKVLPVDGTATVTPTTAKKTYLYVFKGADNKTVTCGFTVYRASATFDPYTLTSTKAQPTLSGVATGLKNVMVVIKKDTFSEKPLYKSKLIAVKNGRWTIAVPTTLSSGTYDIGLYAPDSMAFSYMVSGTLTISMGGAPSVTYNQAKQLFPKTLSGGTSVPVALVQLTNTSTGLATIDGLYIQRTGTADDRAVIGLGASDDKGGSNGLSGGIDGYTPFSQYHTATVPFSLTLNPGETRVITVTAAFSRITPSSGKTIGFDVYGVGTAAKVEGKKIVGTLFTLQ